MAQKPLTASGGEADVIATRLPRGSRARLDKLVKRRGQTTGECVRAAVLDAIEGAEQREVDAKAS